MNMPKEIIISNEIFVTLMNKLERIENLVLESQVFWEGLNKRESYKVADNVLLNSLEAAKLLQVSKRTLARYKQNGIIPFIKYDSGKIMYCYDDIIAYQMNKRQGYEL